MDVFKEEMSKLKEKISRYFKMFKSDIESIKYKGILNFVRKRSIFIASIISIVIIFFVAISFMGDNKEEVTKKFIKGMETSNASLLSKAIRVDGEMVSKEELEPLVKYYENRTEEVNKIVSEIQFKGESNIFKVKKDTKSKFDRYFIEISNVEGIVSSNIKEATFSIADKNYKSGDVIKGIIPGAYTVKYELKTEYGDIVGENEIDLISNADVDIKLPATYITLVSPIYDAKVYIDGKYIDKEVQEVKEFGPIPSGEKIPIVIEKEFPWGIVKSEEVIVTEENIININMNIANETLDADIKKIIDEFYTAAFEALNEKDKTIITNATEEVGDKIFDYINRKTFILSNNYTLSDLQVELEKSDFKYVDDKYSASIVCSISYSVKKKLIPFVKEKGDGMFLLGLDYKDDTWIITGIQKFEME